ncbi:glycoside hydrolase family 16 protein [Clostridium sp. YIM B02505]|uniref:Glycoside hydrolase family 16 protein n=1 Tax=Clostridium yunnanense TaxID=2800325 RepID=A0ABS1EVS6_9CLOT|nr:glycoside hydrolase family 16 protein [Clostridium yunnanense]MBK1813446.1 glycoside hydrolase family 16 protein [Clostridium yunnanense]
MSKIGKFLAIPAILALTASFIPCTNTTTAKAATASTLVWSDEFNGTSINTSNWAFDTGAGGWGNNELQYYTNRSENARVSNGNLVIEARKENYGGAAYTSARLKTQGLKNWTYGRIEARMKLPQGQGLWPAFWMLGQNITQSGIGWPKCGEIDIMEHVNLESVIHGTIHWDTNGHAYYGNQSGNIDVTQYHTYSIQWDASSIKWFVDGVQFNEANIANNINGTEEFHKPFFIILNLAVGGTWPGNPNSSTAFPAQMLVDYVRVYQ